MKYSKILKMFPPIGHGPVDKAAYNRALMALAIKVHAKVPGGVEKSFADIVAPYAGAQRMVREAIGELFGPIASIESEEAVLLCGPEPHHEAEAQIAALQRVRSAVPNETTKAREEIEHFLDARYSGFVNGISKDHLRRWLAALTPVGEQHEKQE